MRKVSYKPMRKDPKDRVSGIQTLFRTSGKKSNEGIDLATGAMKVIGH